MRVKSKHILVSSGLQDEFHSDVVAILHLPSFQSQRNIFVVSDGTDILTVWQHHFFASPIFLDPLNKHLRDCVLVAASKVVAILQSWWWRCQTEFVRIITTTTTNQL